MATYYVAKAGDGGDDAHTSVQAQSISTPWLTLTHAIPLLSPGDTLYVRTGRYTDQLFSYVITFPAGGSDYSQAITISAYQSEVVSLKWIIIRGEDFANYAAVPAYYIWQNLTISFGNPFCVQMDSTATDRTAHHFKFINCEFTDATQSGVIIGVAVGATSPGVDTSHEFINCNSHNNGGTDFHNHGYYISTNYNVWDGGEAHDNPGYGIQFFTTGTRPRITNNIAKNMKLYNNGTVGSGGGGIVVAFADGIQVNNNLVYTNTLDGIFVDYTSGTSHIYNNTIYNNARDGLRCGEFLGDSPDNLFTNNICKDNGNWGIRLLGFSLRSVLSNNDNNGNTSGTISNAGVSTTQSNNITTDPLLTNASASDFTLTSSSPCRDTGISTSPDVTTDYIGTSRPQNLIYDIGAYEFITRKFILSH